MKITKKQIRPKLTGREVLKHYSKKANGSKYDTVDKLV